MRTWELTPQVCSEVLVAYWLKIIIIIIDAAVYPEPLVGRSGAIQAVVNIEIGHGNIDYINIIPGK